MMVNEDQNEDKKEKCICWCWSKQQEIKEDVEEEDIEEEDIEDAEIGEIKNRLNEMNLEDEIIKESSDEESDEEILYVDVNVGEANRMIVRTPQEMIDGKIAESIEELNQKYERSYEQRKQIQINEYVKGKKTEDMKEIDEFEKKYAEDIEKENEEWKQEAKREMTRFEEANLYDIYDMKEQTAFMKDVMAQRQEQTNELLRENERRADEARRMTIRRMIMLERRMTIPEIEGMTDYRDDNEEFEIELFSELDVRIDRRAYSSDSSYYDLRGNYIRMIPWDERVHYARRAERSEKYSDREYEEEDMDDN